MPHPTRHSPVTDQHGQTMAEYSVLVAALVLVVALALPLVGSAIGSLYSAVTQAFGA